MKGKNRNKNENKNARKPEVNEQALNPEVLASSENNPTNDFRPSPAVESKKSVTLNELAEIDPELLTGKSAESAIIPDLPSLPEHKKGKSRDNAPQEKAIPTEINLDKNEAALEQVTVMKQLYEFHTLIMLLNSSLGVFTWKLLSFSCQ